MNHPIRLAVIMDPIAGINPVKDSTLAMLLEAQARGWSLHYGEMKDMWIRDGVAFGRLTALRVTDDTQRWFEFGEVAVTPLGGLDVILMRKDPPFDIEFVFATYVLERAEDQGALVVNSPQSLRDANEKAFVSWFPQCAPPTLISRSLDEMRAFIDEHESAVVKPLDAMAGRSIFVTGVGDGNRNVILETVTLEGTRYAMVQQYIPEIVESGDTRIVLIDGQPLAHALVRKPAPGDHRGNLSSGARSEVRPLSERELWICEQVGPVLRDKGLMFVGIDVIGEYLTEINVTSATGIREIERGCTLRVADRLMDVIESRIISARSLAT